MREHPSLAFSPRLLARWPHLRALEAVSGCAGVAVPTPAAREAEGTGRTSSSSPGSAETLFLAPDEAPPRGARGAVLRLSDSPFDASRFRRRHAPPLLLPYAVAATAEGGGAFAPDPAGPFFPGNASRPPPDPAELRDATVLIRRHRFGGPPHLPDPGAAGPTIAALPPGGAVLCFTAAAARAALRDAQAGGTPVILARDPWDLLPRPQPVADAHLLPDLLAPWSLLDLAREVRGASPPMAVLAQLAGLSCDSLPPHHARAAPSSGPPTIPPADPLGGPPVDLLAGPVGSPVDPGTGVLTGPLAPPLASSAANPLAAALAIDPFRHRPCTLPEAVELLLHWRDRTRENGRVAVALGIAFWKREHVRALLAADAPDAPVLRFAPDARAAERIAARAAARGEPDGIAAWASREPAGLRRPGGPPVFALEDGFLRSRGLGARFLPGASYCLDPGGAYYDPEQPTRLEALLREGIADPALLARARALRQAIVARGIGKYHLSGAAPALRAPAGQRVILVPGQVEDDASVRRGGGALQSNLALLQAVRARHPGDFLVYKPHPDLEAGFRRGRLAADQLDVLADQVVTGTPLSALFPLVHEVHTLTSLSGFEALLREIPVSTYGRPFYAGWGLTRDFAPEPLPRRGLPRTLDELVAAALLLYPRYLDPVTLLPCTAELILERLDDPTAWKLSPLTLHRGLEGWIKRWVAALRGRR